jgi:hypothetical protein
MGERKAAGLQFLFLIYKALPKANFQALLRR